MQEKKYWGSLEERNNDPEYLKTAKQEFVQGDPLLQEMEDNTASNRRSFLKILGFSVGATAALAACQTPVKYALPYVHQPDQTRASITDFYASTFFDGVEYGSILVRSRDGRPIKIEGNPSSLITPQGTSARSQASIYGIYDSKRLREPKKGGNKLAWKDADNQIKQALASGRSVRILTTSITSPATKALLAKMSEKYEGVKVVQYDSISAHGILEAHEKSFGKRVVPAYRFDKAEMIVGFNCDFLGTWISPTEFTAQWAKRRKFTGDDPSIVSRHVQFESNVTITGASADNRIPIKPSQEGALLLKLHNLIASMTGGETLPGQGLDTAGNYINKVANELVAFKGKSLVVSGSNDVNVQLIVNAINAMLGNYEATLDIANHCNLRQGNDKEVDNLLQELSNGSVGLFMVVNANPAYTHPAGNAWAEAIKKAQTSVSLTVTENETSVACQLQLAQSHYLESWDVHEPYKGSLSIQQPLITPFFDTRSFNECLMAWLDETAKPNDYIKDVLGMGDKTWVNFLGAGVSGATVTKKEKTENTNDAGDENPAELVASPVMVRPFGGGGEFKKEALSSAASAVDAKAGKGVEVILYPTVAMGDGSMAHIPWLQELPDPLARTTWDNFVAVPIKMATEKGIKTHDLVKVTVGKNTVELPAFVMPGQQAECVAIALGYGRTVVGDAGLNSGKNVFPMLSSDNGVLQYYATGVSVEKAGGKYQLAIVQTHGTTMGRDVIRETTKEGYSKYIKEYQTERDHLLTHLVSLYPERPQLGHRWVMAIDLNACTGCGACVVACNAENNVAVVGRDEVRRGREMHWIRIDRYFSDSTPDKKGDWNENPAEEPDITFQPMLCQHCGDAPCENVCPVLATVHSSEGLNQQAYNRCFGTRYCANNCPYKVRRFNWFDYTNQKNFQYSPTAVDEQHGLERFVLNPDVSIRARGVMEKCSFCAQRLQAGKLEAKKAGRVLHEDDVKVACAQACPSGAIYFGDVMDEAHQVAHLWPKNSLVTREGKKGYDRAFHVIEELKTRPSIAYLVKVRNRKDEKNAPKA